MAIHDSPHPPVQLTGLSITERLFQGLETRRDAAVVIDGPTGRSLTGAELMDAIRRLAGGLAARGYGPGRTVAVMLPNMPEFIVAFHGVLLTGATVTTVNPVYTDRELAHQLSDSGAELLITLPDFLGRAQAAMPGSRLREIAVVGAASGAIPFGDLMGPPLAAQHPVEVASQVAVLPYSSGTTGLPKGVMLTHRNLVANVDQCQTLLSIRPGEWTIAFLPFFHIYGQTILMNLYLAAGGGIVTMPRFDLAQFLELTARHRARVLFCVPPVVVALAKHPMVDDHDVSSVEILMSGAAPLGPATAELAGARLGATVIQGYGMTELSPVCHLIDHRAPRAGSVGPSLPLTEFRIVDPVTLEDAVDGEEGELWVRGPQVMKGYHNNPAATMATLTPDGWLRTGDLAVVDGDGHVYIRDRLKELIKVKGFQVAPAEIEEALLEHPAIADAAVVGVPDEEAGERPVAFVVPAPGASLTEAAVLAHLAGHLAGYKQPARVTFVEAVPKSASGKILRRVLRERVAESA